MVLIVLCVVLIVAVAIVAIPPDVRELLVENCRDSRGRLKPRYVLRELKAVAEFYERFLFLAAIIATVVLFAVVMVDLYILPLEFLLEALAQLNFDPVVTEEQLRENVGRAAVNRLRSEHMSNDEAVDYVRFLWHAFPVAVLLCFGGLLLCLRMMSQTYNDAVDQLVNEGAKRNRRQIAARYLRDSAQFRPRRRRHDRRGDHDSSLEHDDPDGDDDHGGDDDPDRDDDPDGDDHDGDGKRDPNAG